MLWPEWTWLERAAQRHWRLIEVKPSTGEGAPPVGRGVQRHVLAASGLDTASVSVMHLSRDYIHDGRQPDTAKLFKAVDLTEGTARLVEDCPTLVLAAGCSGEARAAARGAWATLLEAGGARAVAIRSCARVQLRR